MTRQRLGIAALLALMVGALYLAAVDHQFVYDDRVTVMGNPSLRDLSNLEGVLLHQRFRPLVNLSYALDYAAWGQEPAGYHATNIAIHLLNVLFLFAFATRLLGHTREGPARSASNWLPAVAAALFAAHPLMTQAVAYVSGRSELLSTTFFLTALLCLQPVLHSGRWRWCAPALLAWGAALACKETAATLPVVVFAWDRLLVAPKQGGWSRRLRRLHAPLIGIVGLGGLARLLTFQLVEGNPTGVGMLQNIPTQAIVLWRYLGLLVLPVQQSLIHPVRAVETFFDPVAGVAAAGLIALGSGLWRVRKRWPLETLGGVWFFAALAPSTLIPLTEPMSEHRLYLANAGAFLFSAASFTRGIDWLARSRPQVVLPAWVLAGCILIALGVATVSRNEVWRDPVSVWSDAVQKAPNVFAPHYALADAHSERGDCVRAIPQYERALELLSTHPDARNKLGLCYLKLGRADEARAEFQSVLRKRPHHLYALRNLVRVEQLQGNLEHVHRLATRTLAIEPDNATARALLREIQALEPERFGSAPAGSRAESNEAIQLSATEPKTPEG